MSRCFFFFASLLLIFGDLMIVLLVLDSEVGIF